MRPPMQSRPVQRSIASQPFADRRVGGLAEGTRGVQPSDVAIYNPLDDPAWLKAFFKPHPPIFTTIPVSPMPVL